VRRRAAADGVDPDPVLGSQAVAAAADPRDVDAVLAALTGFWLAGAVELASPGLEPIAAAKLHLGRGALGWLQRRLGVTSTGPTSTGPTSIASSRRSC